MAATGRSAGQRAFDLIDDSLPKSMDRVVLSLVLAGLLVLYVPTFVKLAQTIWTRDEQGHGPIILVVVLWLFYNLRQSIDAIEIRPALAWGVPVFVLACLLYIVGHSQAVLSLEVGSLIALLISLLLIFRGKRALRTCWFPLFFMIFMVPLPATLVIWVTTPLKAAVSAVASDWLYWAGFPIGRSGVVLTVGSYQLLVADACAGLNSMFTLEALGILYMNIMNYTSAKRNIFLAVMIIPISFISNIIRVIILVLVTYYFGDEAGQGFVHGFAGMVLFLVALSLILTVDHGMNRLANTFRGSR